MFRNAINTTDYCNAVARLITAKRLPYEVVEKPE